ALLLLILSLLPILRSEAWWIRILDFSRLQIAGAALLLIVVDLLVLDLGTAWAWLAIALAVLALLYQAAWILPYSPLFRSEVKRAAESDPACRLSLLNANVLGGNRNSQALIEQVKHWQPDLVITLETDAWWQEQLESLEQDYPYCIKCPQE